MSKILSSKNLTRIGMRKNKVVETMEEMIIVKPTTVIAFSVLHPN
jgi:hypothetical protein